MSIIEKNISNFVEQQFPQIYREEGPIFVEFVKKYYEWMEQSNNTLYHSRRLLDYKDVDETVDNFVVYLKEKYLKQIQFDTTIQTRQLIKHSLDLYRSKGTERSVDLFFRSIFGRPAEVYYPGEDIFRLSDGKWVRPTYLEVTPSEYNEQFVGKQVVGVSSGATAFVERFVRRKILNKYINVLYISAINGNFETGEFVTLPNQSLKNIPTIIGSLTTVQVVIGGSDFRVGDIVDITNEDGKQGKARVSSISDITGIVSFEILDSGWGYSSNTRVLVSEKVLTVSNCVPLTNNTSNTAYSIFETFRQPLANIVIRSTNNAVVPGIGNTLFTYYANGSLAGRGTIIASTTNTTSFSFNANTGVDGSTEFITIADNTLQNGVVIIYKTDSGNTVVSGLTNNTPYFVVGANSSGLKLSLTRGGSAINITPSSTNENGHIITTYGAEVFVSENVGSLSPVTEPNANLAGTLTISTGIATTNGTSATSNTSNVVTGTSTAFTAELVVGSIINMFAYYANNTLIGSELKRVVSIANDTHLTVDSNNSFTSSKVIIQTVGGKVVVGTGTSFNTDFVYGDKLAVYSNSTAYTIKTVNSVINATYMTVQELFSFSNTSAVYANTTTNNFIYSASNTTVSNTITYTDKSATGNVMGISANVILHVANIAGTLVSGESVSQLNANSIVIANGVVRSITNLVGSNAVITIANTNGVFQPNTSLPIYFRHSNGVLTGANAKIVSYELAIGVVDVENVFNSNVGNYVVGVDSSTSGTLTRISSGALAGFGVSNTFQYAESLTIYTDPIQRYANLPLNSVNFGFPRNPTANVTTQYLDDIFSNATVSIGGISTLVSINPGTNYDVAPFVLLYDPLISPFNRKDYTFELSNTSSIFSIGEVIQQTNGAKGIVRSGNATTLVVKRIQFNNVFDTSLGITGQISGATANIVSISSDPDILQIGLNAVVSANVQTGDGSVTSLDVVDSGFGYIAGKNATFTSNDGQRSGTVRLLLGKRGVSEGFYRNRKGFVSSTKYVFDGEYYQDYSYEVRTSVTADKYAEMLKNIIHVAGTKTFYSVVLSSQSSMQTNIKTDITTE